MRLFKPAVVVAVFGLGMLSACGNSDGASDGATGSSTAPSTGSSGPAATALAALKPYLDDNPSLDLTPLTAKPASGKKITYVSCALAACNDWADTLKEGAAKLGWTVKIVNGGNTPDVITSTWTSIAQNPGDAVIANSLLPDSAIADQLDTLKSKKIPVIELNGPNIPGGAVIAKLGSDEQNRLEGKILADWVISDSDGKGKAAYFNEPSYPDLKAPQEGFTGELKKVCPDCSSETQTFSAADIGKAVPSQVVSYVQSHPDVTYIVFPVGDATAGVPQALAAAGLTDKVKLLTGRSGSLSITAIGSGGQAAATVGASGIPQYMSLDLLAHYWQDGKVAESQPLGILHLVTKDNAPANGKVFSIPDYQNQYYKAWLIS
ncbi:monosaccharide ABC transporter substrate-binding protein (CUT2 family) [Antricoccus suffuscus]|uniref:Monosaccharide ABC transporter substrate-binding protein (CUT2 family) n=1 Tax=Antricoccus suffuscus TaxID=1629062 RepID=A0A2T0ZTN1_9ACTN|nr:sugar ABC transporter substrate-binding protein [Antricoccus suffuscus]PRZ39711.1 monosaccharide ABC transporter substrate-binding protein (CUT2 family) [Antricoccus suffuscus]